MWNFIASLSCQSLDAWLSQCRYTPEETSDLTLKIHRPKEIRFALCSKHRQQIQPRRKMNFLFFCIFFVFLLFSFLYQQGSNPSRSILATSSVICCKRDSIYLEFFYLNFFFFFRFTNFASVNYWSNSCFIRLTGFVIFEFSLNFLNCYLSASRGQ